MFLLLVLSSLNQGLLLEQERLMSDYDKVKAEEQEKDTKLQKLMSVQTTPLLVIHIRYKTVNVGAKSVFFCPES